MEHEIGNNGEESVSMEDAIESAFNREMDNRTSQYIEENRLKLTFQREIARNKEIAGRANNGSTQFYRQAVIDALEWAIKQI